jgi:hypothetical protein
VVAGSVAVALAIERQGIVRGLLGHFQAAEQVLQTIYHRAMRPGAGSVGPHWGRATLYYQEIEALQTFVELHTFQIAHLGRKEFLSAIDAAHRDTFAQGHTATLVHDLQRIAA